MFSSTVPWNRKVSWFTTEISERICAKRQRAQVVAAERIAPAVGIVEAQQQAHDRRLAAARRTDQAEALAGRDAEGQPVMHGAARAGIGEAHILEGDGRRQRLVERRRRRVGHDRAGRRGCGRCPGRPTGRPCPGAARVRSSRIGRKISTPSIRMTSSADSDIAPASTRAGAERQRRRGAAGDRAVGDAARQRVGAEHPHGAAEEVACLDLELVGRAPCSGRTPSASPGPGSNRGTRRRRRHRRSAGRSELRDVPACATAPARTAPPGRSPA